VTELALHWLDVFTDQPFAGNPLAVVLDADALRDEQMQAIAAEVGLSETTFVLDGAERLRIFTPREELPLATARQEHSPPPRVGGRALPVLEGHLRI